LLKTCKGRDERVHMCRGRRWRREGKRCTAMYTSRQLNQPSLGLIVDVSASGEWEQLVVVEENETESIAPEPIQRRPRLPFGSGKDLRARFSRITTTDQGLRPAWSRASEKHPQRPGQSERREATPVRCTCLLSARVSAATAATQRRGRHSHSCTHQWRRGRLCARRLLRSRPRPSGLRTQEDSRGHKVRPSPPPRDDARDCFE